MIRSIFSLFFLLSCNAGEGGGGRGSNRVLGVGSSGGELGNSSGSSGSLGTSGGLHVSGSGGGLGTGGHGDNNPKTLYYRASSSNIPFAQYIGRSLGDILSYNFCENKDGHLLDEADKKSFRSLLQVKVIKDKIAALKADPKAHCKQDLVDFLKKIKELDLSNLGISSLAILSGFQDIERLNLNNNHIPDQQLGYLTGAKKLRTLFIAQNGLTSASVLKEVPSLVSIDLHSNELTEINFIPYMPNIRRVDVSKNKLQNIASILNYSEQFNASFVLNVEGNPNVRTELNSVEEKELNCLLRDEVSFTSECNLTRLRIGLLSTFISDYDEAPGNRINAGN